MRPVALACFALLPALAACGPVTPERAAVRCEERARAAQGPSGNVTIGVNSESGPYTRAEIGVSADYLQGRDPLEVYRSCVVGLTGAEPYRPPVLRGAR